MPKDFLRARKKLAILIAGTLAAGVLVTVPLANKAEAEAQNRSIAATAALSEASGRHHEQLGVYSARAKLVADNEARAVIEKSNRIISKVKTKVDAKPLQVSVASLGEYERLDESTVRDRIADTQKKAKTTSAAAAEVDRRAAEAKAKAKKAEEAKKAAEAKAAEQAKKADEAKASSASASPVDVDPGSARAIARDMAASNYGWGDGEFSCLDSLWARESGWSYTAYNASSGATGIPQALPGSKMASAGSDWETNPATQIAWGLTYINGSYGSPCAAWAHSESFNWY